MRSITQTKFLATNYSYLQGLRLMPIGLCLLLISLWVNNHYGVVVKDFTLPIVFVLGSVLLFLMIDQYYKCTFGVVKLTLTARRIELILTVVVGILTIGTLWVDSEFELPFTPIGLVFAIAFLADNPKAHFPLNKFSIIKFIASTCLIIVSFLPLFLGANWWNAFGIQSATDGILILAGILMIGASVIWHIYFINSLPATEGKDE